MNKISLSRLGIEFETDDYFFRDDGYVDDIHEHSRKVYEEFGDNPNSYDLQILAREGKLPQASGKTMNNHTLSPSPIIIFYLRCKTPLKQIFVIGHEETHVLSTAYRIDLLKEEFSKMGLNIDFGPYFGLDEYEEEELIADIGGLYAAIKQGFSTEEILSFLEKDNRLGVLVVYQKALNFQSTKENY